MGCKNYYEEILKKGNLKATKQRYAILEALDNKEFPVSAEDLYINLIEKEISISLSTVYRILEILYEKGIVTKSILPDYNKAVYEIYHDEHHHHLLCIKCRKMLPIEGCPLEGYEKLLESQFGFTVKGHNLEVYGYCNGCNEQN